eukprot:6196490-Pleurochrysis_carterae.AAC.1
MQCKAHYACDAWRAHACSACVRCAARALNVCGAVPAQAASRMYRGCTQRVAVINCPRIANKARGAPA